jgi:hypothetical protein
MWEYTVSRCALYVLRLLVQTLECSYIADGPAQLMNRVDVALPSVKTVIQQVSRDFTPRRLHIILSVFRYIRNTMETSETILKACCILLMYVFCVFNFFAR